MSERLSTGAPMPPPVWQLLCEFANGTCVCVGRQDAAPCHAVAVVEQRIRDRVFHDIVATHFVRRMPRDVSD